MTILVTGGTKGIGLAIARAFAEPGKLVALNYHGDDAAAARARAEIEALGADCLVVKGDVGTPEGAAAVMQAVAARSDRLDQLVHCAVQVLAAPVLEVDPAAFTRALNLNGTAMLYLVQAALPLMRRGSTVFFLSSRGGRVVVPNYAAVGVGKALAESLVRYLAAELAPKGIRANCIAPGMVDTAALREVFGDRTDGLLADNAASNPTGRAVRDADYTAMIRFLASPAAEMIQGQVIFINGGHNLSA